MTDRTTTASSVGMSEANAPKHLKAGSVEGLETLIARLEAAEVGDLEVDIGVGQALGLIGEGDDPRRLVYTSENGSLTSFGNCFPWPMWTSSLDAALALAERVGLRPYNADASLKGRWRWMVEDPSLVGDLEAEPWMMAEGKTAPLALCAAILKARLSLTLEGEGRIDHSA